MDQAVLDMRKIASQSVDETHNTLQTPTPPPPPPILPNAAKPAATTQKRKLPHRSLMTPSGPALSHPAAPLLQSYSEKGCPANCGPDWSLDRLDEAITRGAHASAKDPAAADALMKETMEQVTQGFARLVPWSKLRQIMSRRLKLSPIAAIPHKSRDYRKILDLSFALDELLSVNESTDEPDAPLHSMNELGWVLPRLIHAMATLSTDDGPLLMCKVDLKDGFWRMVVPTEEEENFAYVLPTANDGDEIMIVIPCALQMGWKLSPPYFCAATETARDVAQVMLDEPTSKLPPHPLEQKMLPEETKAWLEARTTWTAEETCKDDAPGTNLNQLLEVYMDDFIGLIQSKEPQAILHFSRAILHGIHSVFPPPNITNHSGADPISEKKLDAGDGLWEVRKEILGWIFDGVNRTIELPPEKVDKMLDAIKTAKRQGWLGRKAFESLRGKLRHATMGLPDGRTILLPLDQALAKANAQVKTVQIPKGGAIYQTLEDFGELLRHMNTRPTHCRQLVPGAPGYIGYCDACKTGAGGVWISGTKHLPPTVWRVEWPKDIQDSLVTRENKEGIVTVNDLEMAGVLLHTLVLEHLVKDLRHQHAAAWVDNTSAVSWATKMRSKRSRIGHRLVRAFSMRVCVTEMAPLATLSIAGIDNLLADIASRSYTHLVPASCCTEYGFLTHFQQKFPLQNDVKWQLCQLPGKLTSRVFDELRGKPSKMASWRRIPQNNGAIGIIGSTSAGAPTLHWTPCSSTKTTDKPATHLSVSLLGSGKEKPVEELALVPKQFKSRFAPLARNSNWTTNQTRSTGRTATKSTGNRSPE